MIDEESWNPSNSSSTLETIDKFELQLLIPGTPVVPDEHIFESNIDLSLSFLSFFELGNGVGLPKHVKGLSRKLTNKDLLHPSSLSPRIIENKLKGDPNVEALQGLRPIRPIREGSFRSSV
jgi:hypothetical protein